MAGEAQRRDGKCWDAAAGHEIQVSECYERWDNHFSDAFLRLVDTNRRTVKKDGVRAKSSSRPRTP
jgi:hypothetical protein